MAHFHSWDGLTLLLIRLTNMLAHMAHAIFINHR